MRCYRVLSFLRSPKNSAKSEQLRPFVIHIDIAIYIINKSFLFICVCRYIVLIYVLMVLRSVSGVCFEFWLKNILSNISNITPRPAQIR